MKRTFQRAAAFGSAAVTAAIVSACASHGTADAPSVPNAPNAPAWPFDPSSGLRVADMGPVPPLPVWPDNLATDAKKDLGRTMFADARLSGSGKTACGNCHFPPNDFQSGGPKDAPDRSYPKLTPTLPRNSPSLDNIVYAPMARWDGSYFTNVFDLAVLPLAEANMNIAGAHPAGDADTVDIPSAKIALFAKVTGDAGDYVVRFEDAFGVDIRARTADEVWSFAGKAIATYLRVAVSRDSQFDAWNAGNDNAMSPAAVRGFTLFRGSARCSLCHSGPLFSDFQFHNIGTSPPDANGTRVDEGRYGVTHVDADHGAFLTPTLRSAASTSPYLHDGSEVSLAKVIARKASADIRDRDPNHDRILDGIAPLSDADVSDLVQFIEALRGAALSSDATNPVPPIDAGASASQDASP